MANLLNDGEKFELLEAQLKAIPVEMVERRLDERLSEGAQRMLDSLTLKDQTEYDRTLAKFTFAQLILAKHGLRIQGDEINGPFNLPAWIVTARAELDKFIEEDPETREALWDSDFYSSWLPTVNQLDHRSSGWVTPCGPFDNQSFAAGLASGLITIEIPLLD